MPEIRTSRHRGDRGAGAGDRSWFNLTQRWDPVGIILTGHGLALFLLREVANPSAALTLILSLGAWRVMTRLLARSGRGPSGATVTLMGEGGVLGPGSCPGGGGWGY